MNLHRPMVIDNELGLALEETEAVYWSKYYYHEDDSLPCFATIIAGGFAGAVPEVDILAMNRVIGLGMTQIVEQKDIEAIISFFKNAGTRRFFVQVANQTLQNDLPGMLSRAGFRLHNRWAKLMRKLEEHPVYSPTDLRIVDVATKQEKDMYGQILFDSFDWEDERLKGWLCKTIGQMGYRHYLAYHGETPIAAAALHIQRQYASLAFAGTLPEYRGMGAQLALLTRRINEAKEAGCSYIFSETAAPTHEKPVQSFKNMIKLGFKEVYQRENWIFEL